MMGHIYLIRNLVNGKGYIGQTLVSITIRFSQHKSAAKLGSHCALHRAMRKYGIQNFICTEIANCIPLYLDHLERYCIDFYETKTHGYNETDGGGGTSGYVQSAEHLAKLSAVRKGKPSWNKGKKQTPEHIAKLAAVRKGKSHSLETRIKMSNSQKGKKRPPEVVKKWLATKAEKWRQK